MNLRLSWTARPELDDNAHQAEALLLARCTQDNLGISAENSRGCERVAAALSRQGEPRQGSSDSGGPVMEYAERRQRY